MGDKCYDFQSHLPECYDFKSHLPECYMFYSYIPDDDVDEPEDPEDPNIDPGEKPLPPELPFDLVIHWYYIILHGEYGQNTRSLVAIIDFQAEEDGPIVFCIAKVYYEVDYRGVVVGITGVPLYRELSGYGVSKNNIDFLDTFDISDYSSTIALGVSSDILYLDGGDFELLRRAPASSRPYGQFFDEDSYITNSSKRVYYPWETDMCLICMSDDDYTDHCETWDRTASVYLRVVKGIYGDEDVGQAFPAENWNVDQGRYFDHGIFKQEPRPVIPDSGADPFTWEFDDDYPRGMPDYGTNAYGGISVLKSLGGKYSIVTAPDLDPDFKYRNDATCWDNGSSCHWLCQTMMDRRLVFEYSEAYTMPNSNDLLTIAASYGRIWGKTGSEILWTEGEENGSESYPMDGVLTGNAVLMTDGSNTLKQKWIGSD